MCSASAGRKISLDAGLDNFTLDRDPSLVDSEDMLGWLPEDMFMLSWLLFKRREAVQFKEALTVSCVLKWAVLRLHSNATITTVPTVMTTTMVQVMARASHTTSVSDCTR